MVAPLPVGRLCGHGSEGRHWRRQCGGRGPNRAEHRDVVMLFLGVCTGLIVGSFMPTIMLMGGITMGLFGIEFERVSIASSNLPAFGYSDTVQRFSVEASPGRLKLPHSIGIADLASSVNSSRPMPQMPS